MDGWAPFLWTVIEDTLFPKLTASFNVSRFRFLKFNFEDKAPIKLSPAAVVSTAFTLNACTSSWKFLPTIRAPFSPRVITENLTPLFKKNSPAFFASSIEFILIPVKISASVSFGIMISVNFKSFSSIFLLVLGLI